MSEEVTDAAIVERCRGGDVDAFGLLIDRYQKPIFQAILHKVWNYEDAREICQQAFMKAFEHLDTFDVDLKFFSWIYRIAMNESINHLKSRRPWEPLLEDDCYPGSSPDPQAEFESTERGDSLRKALASLDENYRSVLVLCHLLQMSYRDAATALNIDEKTVKSRLFTARQMLRELLVGFGHEN